MLYWNDITSFQSQVPGADQHPRLLPTQLVEALLNPELDWLLTIWRDLFSSFSGRAESTHHTDSTGMSCFHDFCVRFSVSSPFPVSEKLLCYFNVILADEKLSFPTIKTYLAAVCDAFLTLGHGEACHASSISRQASSLASQMYLDVPNYYVDWGLARVVDLGTSATNYLFRHKFQQTQSDYSLHNVM